MPRAYGAQAAFAGLDEELRIHGSVEPEDTIEIIEAVEGPKERTIDRAVVQRYVALGQQILAVVTGLADAGDDHDAIMTELARAWHRRSEEWNLARLHIMSAAGAEIRVLEETLRDHYLGQNPHETVALGEWPDDISSVDEAVDYLTRLIESRDAAGLFGEKALTCMALIKLDFPRAEAEVMRALATWTNTPRFERARWRRKISETRLQVIRRRAEDDDRPLPFICVGHFNGLYCFYSEALRDIVALKPAELRVAENLYRIAPFEVFAGRWPGQDGDADADWKAVTRWLIEECHAAGAAHDFVTRTHGVGVWRNDRTGEITANLGNFCVRDGEILRHQDAMGASQIYIAGKCDLFEDAVEYLHTAALTAEEGLAFVDLLSRFGWAKTTDARLLAGWLASSMVCGALPYRPSVWLTGPSGSGKTTIVSLVVNRLLKGYGHAFGGTSTAPGIRQHNGVGAYPCVIDELEGDSDRAKARVSAILEENRSTTTESDAIVAKGTSSQRVITHRYNSQFMYASIVDSVQESEADARRVTLLQLVHQTGRDAKERFRALKADIPQMITAEFQRRFFRRMFEMTATLIHNFEAITRYTQGFGHNGIGEQIGMLLAGWWTLGHDEPLTDEQAQKIAQDHASLIRSHIDDLPRDADGVKDAFLAIPVPVRVAPANGVSYTDTMNVGTLIEVICGIHKTPGLTVEDATEALGRLGIRVNGASDPFTAEVVYAVGSPQLRGAMRARFANWTAVLSRLPGAISSSEYGSCRFRGLGQGAVKAAMVPVAALGLVARVPMSAEDLPVQDLDDALSESLPVAAPVEPTEDVIQAETDQAVGAWINTRRVATMVTGGVPAPVEEERRTAEALIAQIRADAGEIKPATLTVHAWTLRTLLLNPSWEIGQRYHTRDAAKASADRIAQDRQACAG